MNQIAVSFWPRSRSATVPIVIGSATPRNWGKSKPSRTILK
jgi:hypothetical protein